MGLLGDRGGGKKYKVLYITPDGREYWLTITSTGTFGSNPPFVITELPDGTLETVEGRYSSLHDFAVMHGCYYDAQLISVEPIN